MTVTSPTGPQERVLSTLNKDGSRRWLHPRVSPGRFLTGRRGVAYALILIFTGLPWIRIGGKQSFLLDIPAREFTFFGKTFLPTDTLLLMLFIAGVFVTIFLLTALLGRVWCGWACPQTVYMEFVYRPLERLFDGSPDGRRRGKGGASGLRKVLKYVTYLLVSLFLAHTFLAYFVGVDDLFRWMAHSPFKHPTAFLVMGITTFLMLFDFSFFREQVCIVCCPYGRFQSVMLDRASMIISYDEKRGEPRGKMGKVDGDCVDCQLCVVTCPTGIDIRDGLQMECIGCAQCIDACDSVMDKVKRPLGLIRYSSQDAMERGKQRLLRPRVVLYPLILGIIITLFVTVLVTKDSADVSLVREGRQAYRKLESGEIANDLRVKIMNRSEELRTYTLTVAGLEGARVEASPLDLEPGGRGTVAAIIVAPPGSFELGRATVQVTVADGVDLDRSISYRIQGPMGAGGSG